MERKGNAPDVAPARTEGHVRSADGTRIGFLKLGSGPGLVFCHGSLSTGHDWLPVATRLADRFTCYVMSRRGRGRSDEAPDRSLDREIEDITAVLEAAGPGAHLLGHSYGAICALETAGRSSRVDRLVLYEPPLPVDGPVVGPALETYRAAIASGRHEDALLAGFGHFARLPADEIEMLRKTMVWREALKLAPTWLPELEAIAALEPGLERYRRMERPTLLLFGSTTAPHHRVAIDALRNTLPAARTIAIEGQGHSAHLMTPARVADAVAEFLAASDLGSPP